MFLKHVKGIAFLSGARWFSEIFLAYCSFDGKIDRLSLM
jgi:hypothetical protein